MDPTFASFTTPQGIIVAAGIVTALVQLLKATFPALTDRASGAVLAFAFTLALYVLTGVAVGVPTLDSALLVFTSWLTCATSSVGVYATITHVQATRSGS